MTRRIIIREDHVKMGVKERTNLRITLIPRLEYLVNAVAGRVDP